MSNPLFQALGGARMPAPIGNMQQMMQMLQHFRQTGKFPGQMQQQYESFCQRVHSAPQEEVERMKSLVRQAQSGQVSPAQMQQLAQDCAGFMK